MSEERFKEIKDSIEAQLRIAKAYNYGKDLLEILNEEKDLYDYANELQQELEKYKNIIDELEKWLNETQINSQFIDEETIMEVRSKLKELKGE